MLASSSYDVGADNDTVTASHTKYEDATVLAHQRTTGACERVQAGKYSSGCAGDA